MREMLQAVYGYNAYANGVLLDTVAQLSETQLQSATPSHESIFRLLYHMLGVEAFFLARCQGRPLALERPAPSALGDLRRVWEYTAREAQQFLSARSDEDLASEVVPWSEYPSFHLPMWQLLFQAYNHSHTHRGELSTVLTSLGHPLRIRDIVIYFGEHRGMAWPFTKP